VLKLPEPHVWRLGVEVECCAWDEDVEELSGMPATVNGEECIVVKVEECCALFAVWI